MRVLGIDPGSLCTGYGVVEEEGERLRAVRWGGIRPTGGAHSKGLPWRLQEIQAGLEAVIRDCAPQVAVVEDLFVANNVKAAMRLGQVRGVVLVTAASLGLEVVEYTSLTVKQAVVGYGRAGKPQVQAMVAALLGLPEPPRPNDAADALALAICHLHAIRLNQLLALSLQRS